MRPQELLKAQIWRKVVESRKILRIRRVDGAREYCIILYCGRSRVANY